MIAPLAGSTPDHTELADRYLRAKRFIISAGYAEEIDWQESCDFERVGESDFLREAAWVILSSGMREQVIRSKWSQLSDIFESWRSAAEMLSDERRRETDALKVFRHSGKIRAILDVARTVDRESFANVKTRIRDHGVDYLVSFPFIGPVTCLHLAKNLGVQLAKPDRHLCRVAEATGRKTPALLCAEISDFVGDRVSVVDLVIWRFANLNARYLELFACVGSGNARRRGLGLTRRPSRWVG